MHINLTPASYANAAAVAADFPQKHNMGKSAPSPPSITEVTVLRYGGHMDADTEQQIFTRAPNTIICKVKLQIAKALSNPISLRVGRWSIHPHSKGNFVYSFNRHIPFDIIASYKHILLEPFHGSGQLCPSLGWMQLLAHGVPFMDNEGNAFGPGELLSEAHTLPGLRRAFFAMAPRWLKLIEAIDTPYSSITFTISDPDGAITSALMMGRAALFGRDVTIRKWIDKPPLV